MRLSYFKELNGTLIGGYGPKNFHNSQVNSIIELMTNFNFNKNHDQPFNG